MSWVVARLPIEPGGDEDDYVHTFVWIGKTPINVEWTRAQTLAHRFADRNEASRLALWVDGSGRPRRIVPRGADRLAKARRQIRSIANVLGGIGMHLEIIDDRIGGELREPRTGIASLIEDIASLIEDLDELVATSHLASDSTKEGQRT